MARVLTGRGIAAARRKSPGHEGRGVRKHQEGTSEKGMARRIRAGMISGRGAVRQDFGGKPRTIAK